MNKQIYIIRGDEEESYQAYTLRVSEIEHFIAKLYPLSSLKISMTRQAPPAISVIPFKKSKLAAISIVSESGEVLPELITQNGFRIPHRELIHLCSLIVCTFVIHGNIKSRKIRFHRKEDFFH
jgi:hypothetical protein